jgi:hypothetical protein
MSCVLVCKQAESKLRSVLQEGSAHVSNTKQAGSRIYSTSFDWCRIRIPYMAPAGRIKMPRPTSRLANLITLYRAVAAHSRTKRWRICQGRSTLDSVPLRSTLTVPRPCWMLATVNVSQRGVYAKDTAGMHRQAHPHRPQFSAT